MRLLFAVLAVALILSCRTTKEDDQRYFAASKSSNEGIAGISVNPAPQPNPGKPVPLLPEPADPVEKGAFYTICAAQNQLSTQQALTVKALLTAVHQQTCAAGESWLRDQRNKTLMIESEELVELQTLGLLQNYSHIQDVYIKAAKGVDPICPLRSPQTCHFLKPDFE